jgi:hypothetical protein
MLFADTQPDRSRRRRGHIDQRGAGSRGRDSVGGVFRPRQRPGSKPAGQQWPRRGQGRSHRDCADASGMSRAGAGILWEGHPTPAAAWAQARRQQRPRRGQGRSHRDRADASGMSRAGAGILWEGSSDPDSSMGRSPRTAAAVSRLRPLPQGSRRCVRHEPSRGRVSVGGVFRPRQQPGSTPADSSGRVAAKAAPTGIAPMRQE